MRFLPTEAVGYVCAELPTEDGYTYTLISLLSHLLAEAESLFGPRDSNYTPIGVEIGPGPQPQVWFPGNRRHVVIQLTDNCRHDADQAVFQLAHEVVHLLAPSGKRAAPVVEEGLASLFADHKAAEFNSAYRTHTASYQFCMALAKPLFMNPAWVRELRAEVPSFAAWRAEFIAARLPELADVADALCKPFSEVVDSLS